MAPSAPDPLAPARLGPVTLRNRVMKSATFEGRSPGALVTDDLIDFHVEVARGGVGMTTVAYLAVAPEGRTSADQVYWRPEALPGLRQLTDAVHATGAKVSAQVGHAGPVANPASNKLQGLTPTRILHPMSFTFTKGADAADLDRLVRQHAEAARMAVDVGFDAIELHFGHNYLVSAFLSPVLNRRKDGWGGSLENRARLAREIAAAVKQAAGSQLAVLAKVNMDDGVRGGTTLEESIPFVRMLEADGHLDAVELTGGSSLLNPMYLFKGDAPLSEFAATQPLLLNLGLRMSGSLFFRRYPYTPAYFLEQAKQVRAAVKLPLVLLGGMTDADGFDLAMREGFQFIAMGRALLREPDLINRIAKDRGTRSLCSHCNRCVPTIYTRTVCVERPTDAAS